MKIPKIRVEYRTLGLKGYFDTYCINNRRIFYFLNKNTYVNYYTFYVIIILLWRIKGH